MALKIKKDEIQEFSSTINKLTQMINESKEEIKFLEVEYLHLRGLIEESDNNTKKSETKINPTVKNIDFDDVSKINAEQFDLTLRTDFPESKTNSNDLSENESSDE